MPMVKIHTALPVGQIHAIAAMLVVPIRLFIDGL